MRKDYGFSLLEMMVVVAVFTIITGTVFQLLIQAQQRYKMESEFLDSFQGARLAVDQMTREIHTAGYPPANSFTPAALAAAPQRAAFPFAWSPGYPAAPCNVGGNCAPPGQMDLIIETDLDPQNNNGIEWIRYRLQGTNLERGIATKGVGLDPAISTGVGMVTYVENIANNPANLPPGLLAQIQATYPGMFPGGNPIPMFTYGCAVVGGGVAPCNAGNTSLQIEEVNITIIALSPNPDPRTNQPRLVTLTGRARRLNP